MVLFSTDFRERCRRRESLQNILERLHTPLDLAIWLEVSEETVRDRIASRLQCQRLRFHHQRDAARIFAERPVCPYCDGPLVRRNDDDAAVLQKRLEEFNAKTEPLADFYEKVARCIGSMAIAIAMLFSRYFAPDRAELGMIPIKNAEEIEKMRQACRTASEILDRVSELDSAGNYRRRKSTRPRPISWQEAGVKSAFLGYRLGHRVFPGNICISLNDEIVHGIGSQRRIQYGDIVKLDIGVIQDGWVGDTATTVPVGMIDDRIEQLAAGHGEGAARAQSRWRLKACGWAIFAPKSKRKRCAISFSVVREFVGHGVGRKLHEEPQIPNYGKRGSGPKLKAGMTLAIEPMINLGTAAVRLLDDGWTVCTADGMPSAHFEHTVLITKDEPEILTWRGKTQLK